MRKQHKLIGFRRLSVSPKQNLPPLTAHSHAVSEIGPAFNTYSALSTPKEPRLSTCHKFFTLRPQYPQSPNTDISTQRSGLTSQGMYSPSSTSGLHSDILERIESYELRSRKAVNFDGIQDNFALWEKCFNDVLPELKKKPSDIKNGLIRLCLHYAEVGRQLIKLIHVNNKEEETRHEELYRKYLLVCEENKKINSELEVFKGYKKIEMAVIEKELEEIFGKHDNEINMMRLKAKEFKDNLNKDTVDYLNEIFNSMNKEFEIPEIRNGDFIGMDPNEIPDMLMQKFSLIHNFTTKRVIEMFRSRKNNINVDTQTYTEYIEPSAFEEKHRMAEKLQIQLNTALMSVEKYRESFGSKINVLETLESEKQAISTQLTNLTREKETTSQTLVKTQFELKKTFHDLEISRKEKEALNKEKSKFINDISEKDSSIQVLTETKDKLERNLKEKEEKISLLEKNLAARKKKKKKGQEDEKNEAEPSAKPRPSSKFDEKQFMESLKSNTRRNTKEIIETPGQVKSDPKSPTLKPGQSGMPSTPQSIQKSEKSQPNPSESSPSKLKVTTKLDKIPEVQSPHSKSPAREADRSKSSSREQEISIVSPQGRIYKKSREKSRGTNMTSDIPQDSLTLEDKNHERHSKSKRRRHRSPSNAESKADSKNYKTSNYEDYNSRSDSQDSSIEFEGSNKHVHYLRKPKGSHASQYSDKSQGIEDDYEGSTSVSTRNKSISTTEFSMMNSLEFSKAIQCGESVPSPVADQEGHEGVYVFPYNPNQYYALRGDAYYHTKASVFQAQPRIPDLKDSYLFQSPFHINK